MTYDSQGRQTSLTDPDAGTETYEYDVLDRITKQTDAKGKITTNVYDVFGKLLSTTIDGVATTYDYDSYHRLEKETREGTSVAYTYDDYNRVKTESRTIDASNTLGFTYNYNAQGLLQSTVYPGNVTVGYAYDGYGNLSSVTASNTKVWEFASNNGLRYTATLGGTLTSVEERNSQGLLTSQRMLKGSTLLHNMGYTFNASTGNLTSRSGMLGQTETFGYDSVDRLTSVQHGSTTAMILTYGANGNITSKTGIGTYSYGTKPHAVTGVTNSGSLIDSNTQNITYTAFDKAASINQSGYQLDITYGTDLQRWKSTLKNGSTTVRTTLYAGDYEKVTENGVTKQYYYLHGGNGLAALYVKQSNASDQVYYPCTDHLGSIMKLVDANGTESFKATYDAWGQQTVTTNTLNFHRGYTGHEHLPQFALINMNGRMYDPLLGRFLSPDPFVQLPDFSQNFNRYSYCLNNPLVYVDPDGEWIWLVAGVAGGLINWISNGADLSWEGLSYFGVGFASGVVTAFCPQAYIGIAAANSVANSVLNQGYTNGFNNISWQQTLFDGAMGGAFATIGGALGEKFGAPVQKLFKGVKSPLLREVLVAETMGVPMGAGIGGFMAEMDGNDETSFWDGAWEGAKMSFITSGIGGIASATQYSIKNKVSLWKSESAKYSVYQGTDPITGEVKYVGITKRDPEVRWKEHQNSDSPRAGLEYEKVDNATGLTKIQARIIEQQLINRYGLMKNGGQLYNKINSISSKYWDKYGIK